MLTVYGTRPEAVKLAPLIHSIANDSHLAAKTAITGQHREMLDQVNEIFEIIPDYDLDIFQPGQELNRLMAKVFDGLDAVLSEVRPDAVVVQGDTSTVAAAAIASFYRSIPVVHVEAGLRSHNIRSPFPEEANRKIASQVATLHLAPTSRARENLLAENVQPESIAVTGNTVIDALLYTVQQPHRLEDAALAQALSSEARIILASAHRRENWGLSMEGIAKALHELALTYSDHLLVVPMHRNPKVRDVLVLALEDLANVILTEPLGYRDFIAVLGRSHLVITDSGGIQEEAPALGKPVLVLRENTERPEAVGAGTVKLVGTDPGRIVAEAGELLTDPAAYLRMARAVNPYGDGRAAERSMAAIKDMLGIGERIPNYDPRLDSNSVLI